MLYIEDNCETQISFMFRLEFYLQDFSLNCKKKTEKIPESKAFLAAVAADWSAQVF